MIDIVIKTTGGPKTLENKVSIKKAEIQGDMVGFAYGAREILQSDLQAMLGDHFKHFRIQLVGNQYGYTISVKTADDIGRYLYYGTEEHEITGAPLVNVQEGFGPFWGTVDHPGQKPLKPHIDETIRVAVIRAKALWGMK